MPPIIQSVLPFLNKSSDSPKAMGAEFGPQTSSELSEENTSNPNESKGFQAFAKEISDFLKMNLGSEPQAADLSTMDASDNGVPLDEFEALTGKSLQSEGIILPGTQALIASASALTPEVAPQIPEDKRPSDSLLDTRLAPEFIRRPDFSERSDQSLIASTFASKSASLSSPQGSAAPKNQDMGFAEKLTADIDATTSIRFADKAANPGEPVQGISPEREQGPEQGPSPSVQKNLPADAPKEEVQNQLAAYRPVGPVLSKGDSGSDTNFEVNLARGNENPLDNQISNPLSDRSSQQCTNQQLTETKTANQAASRSQSQIQSQIQSQNQPNETQMHPDLDPLLAEAHQSLDSKSLGDPASINSQQISKFDFDRLKLNRAGLDALGNRTAIPGEPAVKERSLGSIEGLAQNNIDGFKVTDVAQLRADASGLMVNGKNASADEIAASLLSETKEFGALSGSNSDLGSRSLSSSVSASPALSSPLGGSMSQSPGSLQGSLVQQALTSDVASQNWSGEVGGRIRLMMSAGISQAQMELNPAELGRMDILLTSEGDSTKLSFVVQSAMAKEALDLQLPRLREALAEQGISLEETSVKDQSQQGSSAGGNNHQDFLKGEAEEEIWDKEISLDIPSSLNQIRSRSSEGIDAYA